MSSMIGRRNLVAQRGLVDALIEPHAGAVVIVVVVSAAAVSATSVFDALHVDRDVFADIGQRDHGLDRRIRWRRSTRYRLQPLAGARPAGAIRMRSFWPSLRPPSRPRGPSMAAMDFDSSGVAP